MKPNILLTNLLLIQLVFINGIYFLKANNTIIQCLSAHKNIKVDSTSNNPKDEWKTYRDYKYNFEVQYPGICTEVKIKDKDPDKIREQQRKHRKFYFSQDLQFYGVTFGNELVPIFLVEIYLNNQKIDLKEFSFRAIGLSPSKIKWESLTINNHKAIKVMYENFAGGYTGIHKRFFIQKDDKIFGIFLVNPESGTYDSLITRIVSSFKFTGSKDNKFELNKRAINFLKNQKYKEAIALWKDIYSKNPGYAESLNNLGYAYYLNKQYNDAKKVLIQVIKKFPRREIAYKNLAECYEALSDYKGALIYYKQFIRIYPNYKFKEKINQKIIALQKIVQKNDFLTRKSITNKIYGFEIKYQGDFTIGDPGKYYLKDQYHLDYMNEHGASTIISFVLSNREYLNSNLLYAYLSIGVKENVKHFSDCYPNNLRGAGEITRFNGINFSKKIWSDNASGGRHNDLVTYVAIKKNRAFFFVGAIRSFGIGFTDEQIKAIKEGYIYQVNINDLMIKFENIVSTVRFKE